MNKKILIFFLFLLCLILISFFIWANFSPNSPLVKKRQGKLQSFSEQGASASSQKGDFVRVTRQGGSEIIAGQYCSELFKKVLEQIEFNRRQSSDPFLQAFGTKGDINQDRKVNFSDLDFVSQKIEDEKWCQEVLKQW